MKEPVAVLCFWTEYDWEEPERIAKAYYGIRQSSASVKALVFDGFQELFPVKPWEYC